MKYPAPISLNERVNRRITSLMIGLPLILI